MSQTLAIFDLDNTLLNGDSDHAWGEFLIARQLVDVRQHRERNDAFYNDYVDGNLNINDYLIFVLQFLAKKSIDELVPLQREFIQQVIEPMVLPAAESLLNQHRQAGDYLLVITATNEFITKPIAARLGVDELLASEVEIVDRIYTGKPAGVPCFRDGKVTRLNTWLKDHEFDLQHAYFYSDSHNDIPLLKAVGRPVAVDPDDQLQQYASDHGWQCISLRD